MARRKYPIVTNQIYHIFNRGVGDQLIFSDKRSYKRFLVAVRFYQFREPPMKLSTFLDLALDRRAELFEKMARKGKHLVDIICFCLMPNHHHFLLKQLEDKGISRFISNVQNSYSKYFNTRNKRKGSLFQRPFKAVRIETNEQLLHVSRYIHLNPYSSFVVRTPEELKTYAWSSLSDYLGKTNIDFLRKKVVFDNFEDLKQYQKFILNQADYQRTLDINKHLFLD